MLGPDLFPIRIRHLVAKLLDSMGYISMVMLMALRNIPPKKPFLRQKCLEDLVLDKKNVIFGQDHMKDLLLSLIVHHADGS